MSSRTEVAIDARPSNPLDVVPDEMPFDVPYGPPISLDRAQAVIQAAVAEARKRNWKMNIAVADSGGNLVAFQRMDGVDRTHEDVQRWVPHFSRPLREVGLFCLVTKLIVSFGG